MAQFPGLSLTLQGNKMILKSATGRADDRLIITKAVIGDGQLTKSIDSLTSLVNPKLEIGLSNVKEVTNGREGGLMIEGYNDIKTDDTIEAYIMEEIKK